MESKAQAAEALSGRSKGQPALDAAIRAVELYMAAAAQASIKSERARLRRKCQELIQYAERLKSQLASNMSPDEVIIKDASQLHGNDFPPWEGDPPETEFRVSSDGRLFEDDTVFTFSPAQNESFGGWKRPVDIFFPKSTRRGDRDDLDDLFFFARPETCDLVQDATTDCSVVAGLSAAVNILIGKRSILSSIFYPFDHAKGRPIRSTSGKYIMRLNFNGCLRKVVVDDRLPASLTERTFFVVDRKNKNLLWPALLEKAYLKIRGGYDFPGSNSGTDLWVLTGWIPEQLFLQREDLDINDVWIRVKAAYDSHDVVITIGSGCISPEEEEATGLIGEHDYAIQGLREEGEARYLLVKNPWCNGSVWTGVWRSLAAEPTPRLSSSKDAPNLESSSEHQTPGSWWVSLEDVAQTFESMYLNWNPDLFSNRQQRHFSWHMPPSHLASTLAENPQFSITSPDGGPVWVLVSRHFQNAELEIARRRTDSMAAVARQLGFMSILVFDSNGERVQVSGEETYRGPYVDSPQTLARLNTTAGKRYTVVLDQHEFPLKKYTFTLAAFSHSQLQVKEATEPMSFFKEELGTWNRRTAGGNSACATFYTNPQYCLSVPEATPLSILISTDDKDVHIHVDLVWGHGKRVTSIRVKDLISSSGEYRRGCAVAKTPHIDAGEYTVVCSTFDAGCLASFGLRVASKAAIELKPIPIDAAGRLRTPLPPLALDEGMEGIQCPLNANWLTRASASIHKRHRSVQQQKQQQHSGGTVFVRLSVVYGRGPNQVTVAISGEGNFQDPCSTAVRTPEFDIEPERARAEGIWVVVEIMGQHRGVDGLEVELSSDLPAQVGHWEEF
ncbi:Calpain large subunit, domain III [Geosmithia morbida]|uniref:Calpain large subunit, domain III n=1 Tax=Geosmithia morbida TaxID=1094350 RepID=A0A9P5CYC2_9HYPO|nr:Calpain large subunit, domain III [Geosmithia morbida]KAF4120243.1 Calpain large subunit, domain III [Geosmithia morbida]